MSFNNKIEIKKTDEIKKQGLSWHLINASDSPKGFKYKYKAAINASSS